MEIIQSAQINELESYLTLSVIINVLLIIKLLQLYYKKSKIK